MSRHEKLLQRLRSRPTDFTWGELQRLLRALGYKELAGQGSRRKFMHPAGPMISLHEPHPRKELKAYQVREMLEHLKQEGFL